jgi:hypothetical protein
MQFTVAARGTKLWQSAADLVQKSYAEAFGATSFSKPDRFITATNHRLGQTEMLACAGLSFGIDRPFFLERYLDAPVEEIVSSRFDLPCERDDLVEVGPLASTGAKAGTELLRIFPVFMWALGKRYVVCTATKTLEALLGRIGYIFQPLADADAGRLDNADQSAWGSYYDNAPRTGVMRLDTLAHSFFLNSVGRYRMAKLSLLLPEDEDQEARRVA